MKSKIALLSGLMLLIAMNFDLRSPAYSPEISKETGSVPGWKVYTSRWCHYSKRFETKMVRPKANFIGDESGQEQEMSSASIIDGVLQAAFNIQGYDVDINMSEVDSDNCCGKFDGHVWFSVLLGEVSGKGKAIAELRNRRLENGWNETEI